MVALYPKCISLHLKTPLCHYTVCIRQHSSFCNLCPCHLPTTAHHNDQMMLPALLQRQPRSMPCAPGLFFSEKNIDRENIYGKNAVEKCMTKVRGERRTICGKNYKHRLTNISFLCVESNMFYNNIQFYCSSFTAR